MKFRAHFGYDVQKASDECVVVTVGPSLTVQSMAEDADINVLMERYGITGRMPENPRVPMYGDFTSIGDYQSALNAVAEAYDGFMELPAKIRARFNNNPQDLLAFCADDGNIEEARKLGLLKERRNEQPGSGGASGGASSTGAAAPGSPAGAVGGDGVTAGSRSAVPGGGKAAAGA